MNEMGEYLKDKMNKLAMDNNMIRDLMYILKCNLHPNLIHIQFLANS
jgi:hypothetical protein